jgi:hypothetical protein
MTSVEDIEQAIKPFLLTTAQFSIDGKTIKQGKLQLFCIKDFFCVFTLLGLDRTDKKTIYELPYPFSIKTKQKSLEFDYTIDSFCLSNAAIREQTSRVKLTKTSKFFNKRVVVTFA